MDIEADIEVSVKDVVDFYIKINDTTKAKKALAQLSSKDKTVAFDIISASAALREFKVDMAKYFLYDLDSCWRILCRDGFRIRLKVFSNC